MIFCSSDAGQHTGLANTPTRRTLWADSANKAFSSTGDQALAIRLANSAVLADVQRSTSMKAQRIAAKSRR